MLVSPEIVEILTLAYCIFYNFLRDKAPLRYTPPRSFDVENVERGEFQYGDWRSGLSSQEGGLHSVKVVGSNNYKSTAKETREKFCYYFNTTYGAAPWQYNLYKLSCIQFKRHLRKQIGQKINLCIFNREGIFT